MDETCELFRRNPTGSDGLILSPKHVISVSNDKGEAVDGWIFNRGSSFVIRGLWKTGPEFTNDNVITARIDFGPKFVDLDFDLTVTQDAPRNFEAYASNEETLTWPVGVHTVRIVRREPGYLANGDDWVDVLSPVRLEVR